MTITTISSREFNQHASDAKRAAKKAPSLHDLAVPADLS
jgi:hypothetical protein